MISEEDDWYNTALIWQSKANKNYFMLFQAVEKPSNPEPTEPTSNSGFTIYCIKSGKLIVLS